MRFLYKFVHFANSHPFCMSANDGAFILNTTKTKKILVNQYFTSSCDSLNLTAPTRMCVFGMSIVKVCKGCLLKVRVIKAKYVQM